ncbi:peptidylprolyl isomerase [Rhizobium sp. YTU87027]|uniref:peptidylprolyl isomerase n=1 Tax=Rhizobium sp. YTU87027 TaxID=3417741 RepID=UPI003D688BF9
MPRKHRTSCCGSRSLHFDDARIVERFGLLGLTARGDTLRKLDQALFRLGSIGLPPELVRTRCGFHIMTVASRILGRMLPFAFARDHIAERLPAGQTDITGVDLDASASPLVQ